QPLAAADLELRAPELLVRLLELAVRVGQLARRLAHPRLEPGGQVLEPRQHAIEAPRQEGELPAPRHADARLELARLGAAHAADERRHRVPHPPLEEERQEKREEPDRGHQEYAPDAAQPAPA